MRILCVSHYFASKGGGIERVAGKLARELVANGFEVTWAATGSPTEEDTLGLSTISLPAFNPTERFGLPFPLLGPVGIRRLRRAVQASDLVLVHDGMYVPCIAALLFARILARASMLVQHVGAVPMSSPMLEIVMRTIDRCITRPMLKMANRVVFISGTSAQHFSDLRLPASTIFNGVDTDLFCPRGGAPNERLDCGLPQYGTVALFVGRFVEKKGLLRLRRLAEQRSDIHWAFAGSGPIDPDGWDLPNVSTHRGRSGASLAQLYRSADLLILPSNSEGFPLVVQEALACGLRVACCNDAAQADKDAAKMLTAILVDPMDFDGTVMRMEQAVDHILEQQDCQEARQKRADFAASRYSWRIAGQLYSKIIRELTVIRAVLPGFESEKL